MDDYDRIHISLAANHDFMGFLCVSVTAVLVIVNEKNECS